MGEYPASADNHEVRKRMVTLLLALAALAERAGARPRPILWFVLRVLRLAEGIARKFVIDLSHDLDVPTTVLNALRSPLPISAGRDSGRSAEAVRLALAFRRLAAMLGHLSALALARRRRIGHAGLAKLRSAATIGLALRALTHCLPETHSRRMPVYPDTS